MSLRKAEELLEVLERENSSSQNYLARANARYILLGVNEPISKINEELSKLNYNLDKGLDNLAFTYLSVGCTLAENERFEKASKALEKGALLLEYNHFPKNNRRDQSFYFILISSLAYYSSSQYSKSFILIKDIEFETEIGKLITFFLKRDFYSLSLLVNRLLMSTLNERLSDNRDVEGHVHIFLFAKAVSNLLEFIYSGDKSNLFAAQEILSDIQELLIIEGEPSFWWVVRLFKIIVNGFSISSLWTNIPPLIIRDGNNLLDVDPKTFNEEDKEEAIRNYIHSLLFFDKPVVELFVSQRIALNKVLSKKGAVVSLPTSSGKTRVAEIAILQCLLDNPLSKVLYLAPFRSLANEIEVSLNQTFQPLGYEVSYLYGGNQFNKLDKSIIQESKIIIATPEKAKAILRCDEDVSKEIKLVIIDEGHLLDSSERYLRNELFLEELKYHVNKNNGKIILLSAVLPNTEEIALWITENENQRAESNWRPSSQRLGILSFNGYNVNIEWQGQEKSFNYNFIDSWPKAGNPKRKEQAVASTAVKISSFGSVLIFVGGTRNVETTVLKYASEIVKAFGNAPEFDWKNKEALNAFVLACVEIYGENSAYLKVVKYGILCHHGKLPSGLRLHVETLIQKDSPRIIIATTTLAQGVNLGVSTVIIASPWVSGTTISNQDFWNIAGRAGRAFVDTEGKILFFIDKYIEKKSLKESNEDYIKRVNRRRWQIRESGKLCLGYFNSSKLDEALSGFLKKIKEIKETSEGVNLNFDYLLQLISENDLSEVKDQNKELHSNLGNFFDWIDDTLLALDIQLSQENLSLDDYFRKSLAFIQAEKVEGVTGEEVINFINARNKAIKEKIAVEPQKWKSFVRSSLPLTSAIKLDNLHDEIVSVVKEFRLSEMRFLDTVNFLAEIELLISSLPSSQFSINYEIDELNAVRQFWLSGYPLNNIVDRHKFCIDICEKYYGFSIPWVLNAIAKKMADENYKDESTEFEELAILCESGLPNILAAKIFYGGVKSRNAAREISEIIDYNLSQGSVTDIISYLIANKDEVMRVCSTETCQWVEILLKGKERTRRKIKRFEDFTINGQTNVMSNVLYVKKFEGSYFLCNHDYSEKIEVEESIEFPFSLVADNPGIFFEFTKNGWSMRSRNNKIWLVD